MTKLAILYQTSPHNSSDAFVLVGPEGTTLPAKGRLNHSAKIDEQQIFHFVPDDKGQWVIIATGLESQEGATRIGFQNAGEESLYIMGDLAILEKTNEDGPILYMDGRRYDIAPPILAALRSSVGGRPSVASIAAPMSGALQRLIIQQLSKDCEAAFWGLIWGMNLLTKM